MNTLKPEKEESSKQKKQGRKSRKPSGRDRKVVRSITDILNGNFLSRENVTQHLPFLFFVALLIVFYIGYGYFAERSIRQIYKTEMELKELKSQYISIKTRLVDVSKQSKVAERTLVMGIKESLEPPKKIIVNEEDFTGK